jgi:hypothetical protein
MNGRAYDYSLGRFLSVDPIIQFPANSQSLNPYSYILNNPFAGRDPSGFAMCSSVSLTEAGSGTCDFSQNGKTTEVGYSVGGGGNVAIGSPKNLSALSGAASTGVLKLSNGADKMTALGPQSADSRGGVSAASGIGSMASSIGHKASSIVAPNITAWGERGVEGSLGEAAIGGLKALANLGIGLGNLAQMYSNPGAVFMPGMLMPEISISDRELGGAAAVDVGLFALSALRVAGVGANVGRSARSAFVKPGSFSITDWTGYPSGVARPQGPFRLIEGAEYDAARSAANVANGAIRRERGLVGQSVDIHELQPVKFGGSPIDAANKVILPRDLHRQQVTPWWNQLMRDISDP